MAQVLKDSDFHDGPVLQDSDFHDAPTGLEQAAANAAPAVMRSIPSIQKAIPAVMGAAAGAGTGAIEGMPLGPWGAGLGAVGGAFLGGFGGQSLQGIWEQLTRQRNPMTAAQTLSEANTAGKEQAMAEGAFQAAKLAPWAGKGLRNLYADSQTLMSKIEPKFAQAATENPAKFAMAPSDKEVSSLYDGMYAKISKSEGMPVTGRKEYLMNQGDPFESVSRAKADMVSANQALQDGTLTMQEAINASQAARFMRDMKMRGNELAQEYAQTADSLKTKFDDFIQSAHPEWQKARDAAFWNAARSEYDSLLPRNLNGRADAIRSYGGLATGVGMTMAGHPLAMTLPIYQAPALHGAAIKTAGYVGLGAQKIADALGGAVTPIVEGGVETGKLAIRLGSVHDILGNNQPSK